MLIAPAVAEAGKVREESFESGGETRTYSLAVPEDLSADTDPVPLLITLHGSGRDGASLVKPWRKLGEKEGFLVAGPDATVSDYWEGGVDGPDMLRDLVDHLAEEYPVDRRRVYLFGHSAGARFALQMALLESQYFAAVALHAGALTGGTETWLPTLATRNIPIHITVGTRDRFFPVQMVRDTKEILETVGIPVELVEIPGHDHDYYGRSKRINEAAWEFLGAHALEGEPVFEPREFGS